MTITQINRSLLVERRTPRQAALPIALAAAIASLALSQTAVAQVSANQLPTGGSITGGTGTINLPNGASQVITQTSNRLALNWSTFDIGSAATMTFNQPSSSAVVLNRVQGGNPTQIFGNLNANGQVFLINTNGMIFGSTAKINVGGLVASTLGLTASDFMAGNDVLDAGGSTVALMFSSGTINAAAGAVDLIGGKVVNNGVITATAGNINLVGADRVTLNFETGGFGVVVDRPLQLQLDTLAVDNTGSLIAPGGTITLQARAAQGIFNQLINNSGTIRASAVSSGIDGSVSLVATGASSVDVGGSGSIDVGTGSISYSSARSVTQSGVVTAGDVVVNVGGNLLFTGSNRIARISGVVGNELRVTNARDMSQQAALTVAGASSFALGTNALNLDNAANDFANTVNIVAGAVRIADSNALSLGNLSTGALTASSNGALNLGSGAIVGALSANSGNGSISQAGALNVSGPGTVNAGSGAISLDNNANDFGGSVSLTGTGVRVYDVNNLNVVSLTNGSNGSISLLAGAALSLPAQSLSTGTGNLSLVANGGALTTAGSLSGGNISLSARNGIIIGHDISASGTLGLTAIDSAIVQTAGAVNIGGATAINAGNGAISLEQAGNDFGGAVGLTGGSARLADVNALALGASQIAGSLSVRSGGDLRLVGAARASNADLAAGGLFQNDVGAGALDVSGRWHVYLATPSAGHVFGGLDSGNAAVWNTAAFGGVPASGNRYVFAFQPTLLWTSTNLSKTYGDTINVANAFTVSGLMQGVAGAYRSDVLADVVNGAPSLSSTGSVATASVAGSPYAIQIAQGTLDTASSGYALAFDSSGLLGVDRAGLTVTAANAGKTYGQTANLTGFTVGGLRNADAVSSVGLASAGAVATANVGDYTITASNADGTGLSNYDITYTDGVLSVGKAGLTITAANAGKTYGQTAVLNGYSVAGLQNADAVASVDLASAGTVATANVGDYTITATNADGTGLSNYDITYTDGVLSVGKAGLTITAANAGKTYGQTAVL
ncbi:MAG: filamentous hemagglutinin N-terminal domain-containing protein, partial [Luteimonas sp.]